MQSPESSNSWEPEKNPSRKGPRYNLTADLGWDRSAFHCVEEMQGIDVDQTRRETDALALGHDKIGKGWAKLSTQYRQGLAKAVTRLLGAPTRP